MSVCALEAPVGEQASFGRAAEPFSLAGANINPVTGLSTDYLNHFNEAIMLLEMLAGMPECADDLAAWRPLDYREHFRRSNLKLSEPAIAAYDRAEPETRQRFDRLCDTMTGMITVAQHAIERDPEAARGAIALAAAAKLKPLVARTSAVIHGHDAGQRNAATIQAYQAAIDAVIAP
jgi:hypothetical protein